MVGMDEKEKGWKNMVEMAREEEALRAPCN